MSWKWNNAAVDSALEAMPEEFGLKKLLIANKAEVKQMCITEYNEDDKKVLEYYKFIICQ